ncbi:hypothetical protein ABZV61_24775 [Streptomyces sp900116325]|uniref:Transposase n=1 Tax=Streptomyces sp. 900116325 TaxID=3154295 RepID=A0ABV2UEP9_9ACTN
MATALRVSERSVERWRRQWREGGAGSQSAPAAGPSAPPASMSTLVSDAHSFDRPRPNKLGWSTSATT